MRLIKNLTGVLRMPFSRILFVLFSLLFGCSSLVVAAADRQAIWDLQSERAELSRFVEYWPEPAQPAGIEAVAALDPQRWTQNRSDTLSLGYSESAYWFRVAVENPTNQAIESLLEIAYPVLDRIEIFINPESSAAESFVLGDKRPFYSRPIEHRNFVVPLTIAAGEQTWIYLRVQTTSSMQVPLILWNQNSFLAAEQARSMFEGLYYGIFSVMMLYNLFVFMAVKELSFLHYVGYITAMPLFMASLHGVAFQYLWPQATWWNDQAISVLLNLTLMFGAIFSVRFINVSANNHPLLHRWTVGVIAFAGVLAVAGLMVPYKYLVLPTILLAFITCSTMLVLSIVRWVQQDPAARYYTFAWVFMLLGGMVLALSKFTVLPRNLLTENAAQVGSALGVILLSIALADRLEREKKRVFETQQRLIREERKARMAQEKSLQVQREANTQLEERVQQRTQDLEHLNEQLLELSATDALTRLKNRGHFDRIFRSAVVRAYRYDEILSLLVLDIDHFKKFNDTYGHLVGDDCLQMVSQCIQKFITRPQDLAARYGGEEFVVLLPDTPMSGALQVAERIRMEIEKTAFPVSGDVVHLTVSIGVCSVSPAKADATKDIFKWADEALYEAKGQGRNRVVAWNTDNQPVGSSVSPA